MEDHLLRVLSINKIDIAPYVRTDLTAVESYAHRGKPKTLTGEGICLGYRKATVS